MAYLGKTPSQAVRSRYYFTATGGETSLSGTDDNSNTLTFSDGNYVDVALNGVALVAGTDYNTTTANTIGGLTALTASDVVEVIVYDTFSVFSGEFSGDISLGDNVKAKFGAGDDLQIYHDGSNSFIKDSGTGNLTIQAEDFAVQSPDASATHIFVDSSSGYTSLSHGGSTKLNTTSTGVDVTGTLTADGLTVDGSATISNNLGRITLSDSDGTNQNGFFEASGGVAAITSQNNTSHGQIRFKTYNGTDTTTRANIYGNGDISFFADDGTTQALYWDASTQRLGLGTTSPGNELHVYRSTAGTAGRLQSGGTNVSLQLSNSTDADGYLQYNGANMAFFTSGSERVRIDSSGNLGVGTASPSGLLNPHNASGDANVFITTGTTNSSNTILFGDSDSTDRGRVQYDHSNDSMRFNTAGSERMRVDSSGNVGIGTTSPSGQLHLNKTSDLIFGQNGYGIAWGGDNGNPKIFATSGSDLSIKAGGGSVKFVFKANGDYIQSSSVGNFDENGNYNAIKLNQDEILTTTTATVANTHMAFSNPNGRVGSITTSGSGTSYNTSSDHRLKENVVDMTGAITRVKSLSPKRFNFIADDSVTVDGFLAHEAATVVPEAVSGTHNEVDDDGNAVMQGIDQSKLVPLLTGALQEAITKIETLETEMTALKARVTTLENA